MAGGKGDEDLRRRGRQRARWREPCCLKNCTCGRRCSHEGLTSSRTGRELAPDSSRSPIAAVRGVNGCKL